MTEGQLHDMLAEAAGVPVVFSHQNAPRPRPPYVLVEETGADRVRVDYCYDKGVYVIEDRVTLRVHWHGKGALRALTALVADTPGLQWVSRVQRAPASLEDVQWEDRAICEAAYGSVREVDRSNAEGIIEAVETTPTIESRQWPAFIVRR